MVFAVFLLKGIPEAESASSQNLVIQNQEALARHKPIFVFLHSQDCDPCKEMMAVVAPVYPEFQKKAVLIEVDVDDPSNRNILRRERLQANPTLVFNDGMRARQLDRGRQTWCPSHHD